MHYKEILESYYKVNEDKPEESAKKLHNVVDKILKRFGGITDIDRDECYSIANLEITKYVKSQLDKGIEDFDEDQFNGFIYFAISRKVKMHITRKNRQKRCKIVTKVEDGKEIKEYIYPTSLDNLMQNVRITIAKDHGVYPKYKPEAIEQSAFYSKNALGETKELVSSFGLRNSQLLTIAPTGSLSTMLGVSGGIEPIFANYYTRKTESLKGHDEYYKVYTPIVKKYIDEHNLKDDSELPDYFVTAQTLDYKNRIYMQSIWQSHIDASISSTVNVPNDFTIEQVESLYMSAWESGLKGVTIFRDGCKRSGILTTTSSVSDINDDKEKKTLPRGYIVVADDNVIGLKRKVMSGCGSLHIVAMFDPITGELLETYISKGSTGGCQSNLAAVSRLISLSARAGVDVYTIADQLKSCPACPSYVGRTMTKHDTSKGKCCPDAIANALIDMYKEMKNSIFSDDIETSNVKSKVIKKNTEDKEQSVNVKNPCPVCGEELTFEGGCNVCKACGWSKCD